MTKSSKAETAINGDNITCIQDTYDACSDSKLFVDLIRGNSSSAPEEGLTLISTFLNIRDVRVRKARVDLLLVLTPRATDVPFFGE